eukprot:scaffold64744_cov69-Phaeocystis_antarctica.AAC.2
MPIHITSVQSSVSKPHKIECWALLLEVGLVFFCGGKRIAKQVEPLQRRTAPERLEAARQLVVMQVDLHQRRATPERLEFRSGSSPPERWLPAAPPCSWRCRSAVQFCRGSSPPVKSLPHRRSSCSAGSLSSGNGPRSPQCSRRRLRSTALHTAASPKVAAQVLFRFDCDISSSSSELPAPSSTGTICDRRHASIMNLASIVRTRPCRACSTTSCVSLPVYNSTARHGPEPWPRAARATALDGERWHEKRAVARATTARPPLVPPLKAPPRATTATLSTPTRGCSRWSCCRRALEHARPLTASKRGTPSLVLLTASMICWNVSSGSASSVTISAAAACARVLMCPSSSPIGVWMGGCCGQCTADNTFSRERERD